MQPGSPKKGEIWQADSHQHHDSTDHYHAPVVILTSHETEIFGMRTAAELGDIPVLSGAPGMDQVHPREKLFEDLTWFAHYVDGRLRPFHHRTTS